ncbi:MAG: hypothetical protein ABIT23_01755 [Nitrosospira sp.]
MPLHIALHEHPRASPALAQSFMAAGMGCVEQIVNSLTGENDCISFNLKPLNNSSRSGFTRKMSVK